MWKFWSSGDVDLVGTCNGLLCLRSGAEPSYVPHRRRHDEQRIYCAITVLNPSTYQKIVFTFTLSEIDTGSWRELPAAALNNIIPDADSSFHDTGDVLVTVDGATHWLTARAERVVALDLDDERVVCFEAPPVVKLLKVPEKATCQLTNVHERLGVMVMRQHTPAARVDLWMLEDDGGHRHRRWRSPPRWSRRCSLMEPSIPGDGRWITSPHFTHGEYVLSKREAGGATWLYRHRMGDLTKNDGGEKAQMWPLEGEELMCNSRAGVMTFPFVETTEPLPIWE
nr:unnamed protein product [Digitaria exilis]